MTTFSPPQQIGDPRDEAHPAGVLPGLSLALGILSLACCCVPFLGVIAGPSAMLSGAVVLRRGSHARGRGVAIGGLVTGLLGMIAGIVVLGGVAYTMMQARSFSNQVGIAITAAQDGDSSKLSALVAPETGPLKDEDIAAFNDRVKAKLGKFQKPHGGLWDLIPVTVKFVLSDQARAQRLSAKYTAIIYPAQFDNGRGVVVLLVPNGAAAPGPAGFPPLANVGVYQEGSTDVIWLVQPPP
ncbi:MAG: hypothetical protein ACOYN0_03570 [Phycisphaerales bacterium]